ncbi:MAG: adenine deaminase [Bdellovibrionales bacterium]|nr:adenine deaminase [Bdellovibrionales bacterium]
MSIIQASLGKIPCDLVLKNARIFDVFSGAWFAGDIAIHQGVIAGTDLGYKGRREIDLKGRAVVPGFIDAHVHIESSCMIPGYFEQVVLPHGTTTAICDPHELANVQGRSGIEYFLKASETMKLDLQVMMSSCVPATHLETNGGGALEAAVLHELVRHPQALGLAEMMNVPGVLFEDPGIRQKLDAFKSLGRPIDGHAPLVRGKDLSAYACTGITSCHESSELAEAQEKVRKGIAVWIREGSVAKDLHTLIPLLDEYRSASVGFCTDDRNPLDISQEGHLDFMIRESLRAGVKPEVAYRAASWTVAHHYGLDKLRDGRKYRIGAIAPGYLANLVILDDVQTCAISQVFRAGVAVNELEFDTTLTADGKFANSMRASTPSAADLTGPSGQVHVMKVIPGKLITDRYVTSHDAPEVSHISVLERYGHCRKPSNAYVAGFGDLKGAIASSVGHDSHNLIVVGKNLEDMRTALAHLISVGGGFCVVKKGKIIADLPLPLGGLMSSMDSKSMIAKLRGLREASYKIGCELAEPFLQLAFLSLPVIPSLKLTDQGLVDVQKFGFIDVRAS